jgi:Fur family zinc uptake transcriptional regulator
MKKPIKGPNKVVRDVLAESEKPLGAYEILERVKVKGISGPPTIYRALDKLIKLGLAHRITSTHSYMMCQHGKEHDGESIIFAVCQACDHVDEIPNKALHNAFDSIRSKNGFHIENEVVEVVGTCRSCSQRKGA